MLYQTYTARRPPKSPPAATELFRLPLHDVIAASAFRSVVAGDWWEWTARFFVSGAWPWPLTLTLKVILARSNARLPLFPVNLAQIPSAVPEIFEAQTNKQTNKRVTDSAKNSTILACGNDLSGRYLARRLTMTPSGSSSQVKIIDIWSTAIISVSYWLLLLLFVTFAHKTCSLFP